MKQIKLYSEIIITPLEQKIKELEKKIHSKKYYASKKTDEKYLEHLEIILLEYYEKYAKFIEEEMNYNKNNKYAQK